MTSLVADIAVPVSIDRTFHYLVPEELGDRLVIGSRVLVPFRTSRLVGTIVGFLSATETQGLRPVIATAGEPLAKDIVTLAHWMSDYYLHPLGLVFDAVVPRALERVTARKARFLELAHGDHDMNAIRGPKQKALLLLLCDRQIVAMDELRQFSAETVRTLCERGFARIIEREDRGTARASEFTPSAAPVLMPEQDAAVRRICEAAGAGEFRVFLLHGVTGSGKTEVYLQVIAAVSGTGKGSIVLVPEIALTPQLLGRFRSRFGDRVAVLHSGLSDRERADEYLRIRSGKVDVVIGARSAVFAPFTAIGAIIVDEEQENSYKQEEGLRYHARDVAIMRAKFHNAVAVLGSATPSLESFANARSDKFTYLRLANRVDHRPMPDVLIIDHKAASQGALFHPRLAAAITERMERGEQALLLLNRRGYSSVLICNDCGTAVRCPSCSVSLTFHKAERELKCHYCGHVAVLPERCPSCAGSRLDRVGSGTQRIEEELRALFPRARIARMDSDSVKGRDAYETLLRQVDRGLVDILLGTQMVAKGHDFPRVTLVGIVDADVGLNLPDFRAAERTFQLVTQAAGRSGRGELGGEVIIQTMNPGHYAIRHSRSHDYEGFYNEEMAFRTQLGYPPVGRIIKIEIKSAQERLAEQAAGLAHDAIRRRVRGKEIALLGPAPAPVSRVRGQYRFHLLLLSQRRDRLRLLAQEGRKAVEDKFGRKCRVIVDVDPVNLL